jgi:hypothetical protein
MSSAIFNQPITILVVREGGDCPPYTRPTPTNIITDLDQVPIFQIAGAIVTNLCSEVT